MPKTVVMKPLTVAQRAYIAGIIDGEGHITIAKRNGTPSRGYRHGCCFRLMVGVANTDLSLLEWLQKATGLGGISKFSKKNNPRAKVSYRWTIWTQQARQVLESIRDFLVIKQKRCDIALNFSREVGLRNWKNGRNGLGDNHWNFQRKAWNRMKLLNQRGVQTSNV